MGRRYGDPELTPVVAMDPIQVYLLRDIRFLFTRSYNCQQSALEFYYQHNGFYNSVYLYFPDMVAELSPFHP